MNFENRRWFFVFIGLNLVSFFLLCGVEYYRINDTTEKTERAAPPSKPREDPIAPPQPEQPQDKPTPEVPHQDEPQQPPPDVPDQDEPQEEPAPDVPQQDEPPEGTPKTELRLPYGYVPLDNPVCSDIDVVYTWVNGSDPYVNKLYSSVFGESLTVDGQLRDIPTLKYSIRATMKFAPFIRHIIIITNGQVPDWLNVSNPRVRIVTHQDIYENPAFLPTFNSNAIETQLHRIPGVAPCFWWLNDDFCFGRPLDLKDWINSETGQQYLAFLIGTAPTSRPGNNFDYSVSYTNYLINKYLFPQDMTPSTTIMTVRHRNKYEGHGARFIIQKNFEAMYEKFHEEMYNTSSHRLRQKDDVSIAFLYNHFVRIALNGIDSPTLGHGMAIDYFWGKPEQDRATMKRLIERKPICWCINDNAPAPKNDEEWQVIKKSIDGVVEELEKAYPEPCEVENIY